jgi:CRP-like cAMP-binding protein
MLKPGDVDGDIQLLLRMPPPYTARAIDPVECLYLTADGFDRLLAQRAQVARRWLTSVATRLAHSQNRLLGLLGGTLTQQTARLLLDEADETGQIALPQRTLAAMLGAQRPSVNKVLRELAHQHLIELAYRSIRIMDRDGLARAAN